MVYTLSRLSGGMYRGVIKKLLFRHHPDAVHEHTSRIGGLVGRVWLLRKLIDGVWSYKNEAVLAQTIAGIRFTNPVGLSAGFDNNFTLPRLLKAIGFGFMEGGSATFRPCPGSPHPWFHRLPHTKSLVVYKGLGNDGIDVISQRVAAYPKDVFANFPLNISVAKTNLPVTCSEAEAVDDYIGSLKVIKERGVGDIITINISCPNTYGGEPFTNVRSLGKLLKRVDELKLKQPLFLKMPSDLDWDGFHALLDVATKHRVAGVTIHNLAKSRDAVDPRDTLTPDIKGNLSGVPTRETSNMLIKKTRQTYGDRFVIIGVGGIFSAEDAYTKIRLGADLVALITGMIFEGPSLIGQINYGLVKLLERDGFGSISEAVGVDLSDS